MFPFLPVAGALASFFAGGKSATAPYPAMDPALFGTPDPSMLDPTLDKGYQQTVNNLNAGAQNTFASGIPQIASLMASRFGSAGGAAPGMEGQLLGQAHNAAFASTIPQIAQLMAQQRAMGMQRYMSAINAARQWQMQRAQAIAQQHASLAGGFMDLGGKLLGAAIFHGKNSTADPTSLLGGGGGGGGSFDWGGAGGGDFAPGGQYN